MRTFHVRYKTGATFTYVREIKSKLWLEYYVRQFRQDPSVERVLVEVV